MSDRCKTPYARSCAGEDHKILPTIGEWGGQFALKNEYTSLRDIKIFQGLCSEDLDQISTQCYWRTHAGEQMIVSYLDDSTDVFFLTSGRARIIIYSPQGKTVSFHDIGPGDTFGDFAAVDGAPRCANVEALEPCTVGIITAAKFRELLHEHSSVANELVRRLVGEVRRLTDRVYQFSTLAVQNRIQAELLRLARSTANGSNRVAITPIPKQAEIASRTSTHREAVSREISRLVQLGVVERKGTDLLIADLDRLSEMVHEAAGE